MEEVKGKLQVFSAILLQQYIRTMTAADYHKSAKSKKISKFRISAENYQKMRAYPLQTPLLNLQLNYDEKSEILSVIPNEEFLHQYENKIMQDVSIKYFENYKDRYADYIQWLE